MWLCLSVCATARLDGTPRQRLARRESSLCRKRRRIRLLDGTTVPKAGKEAKNNNGLWRLHCTFDLPTERFSHIELTDEKGGERLDRMSSPKAISPSPIEGTCIPILWRISWSKAPMSSCARAGKAPRWLGEDGKPFDILAALAARRASVISTAHLDRPQKSSAAGPSARRVPQAQEAAEASRAKARAAAKREGNVISAGTLTPPNGLSLSPRSMQRPSPPRDGELYRARWRIEIAFKRLKSLLGLSAPPSEDPEMAKTWILAHLLMVLLLEPHTSAPEISPRMAA